jgi:lipopolysaccharide export system protein LptA
MNKSIKRILVTKPHLLSLFSFIFFLLSIFHSLTSQSQETTKILLDRADNWKYNKDIGADIQRIIGNVIMHHDSAYLYCDSAYLNEGANSVIAYGNVHVKLSDTLNLFGDSLRYDGNTKIARAHSNVRLVDNETVLTTDTLVYYRLTQIAQYDYWGKIVNDKNILVSKHGYYYTDKKEFFFKHKVLLTNPDCRMHSDTLMYNTVTKTAYFFGPSDIKSREDSIACENGWYNTKLDIARFRERATIFHNEQRVTGDSMYYEKHTGYGQIFRNAVLTDTLKDIILKGEYGEIQRKKGFAFMTQRALAIMVDKQDSLFLHSDTIRATFDSAQNIKNIFFFYKTKFFRKDLQGMSDSMTYHGADSVITMYKDPVIWADKNQLTADSITLTIRNGQLDSLVMYSSAFIVSEDDTNKYNQVKGRDMVGYIRNSELYKIRVLGNSQTIYYVREEDRTLIGINKAIASDMLIFLENKEVKSITYIDQPVATLYPEKDISPFDLKLKGFKWITGRRPLTKSDIFYW